ncbi:RTA1 like protein-domain-containing protein [Mycena pura]|uniref:RTA1 like protein-domain-containing protein n=1 Tax=Mycena pura TaxID=153505 RepID=A0AAD6YGD5_9AGAR|nr:RTA1 like protein-domain-containing protein [Mycena pura]
MQLIVSAAMSCRLLLLVLTACFAIVFAAGAGNSTSDGTDLSDRIIGGFIPKKTPAFIAIILYGASAIVHWTQFFLVTPRRPFILTLTLGMTAMATGFILRVIFSDDPTSLGKYIAMDLPCLFLATDYMTFSRLVATFDTEVSDRCLLIRTSRIVKIFVWSDVSTFLLQSTGGALTSSHNVSSANLGNKIAMIGLILQAASFLLFTVILVVFRFRVLNHFPKVWRPNNTLGHRPFKLFSTEPIDDRRIVFYVTGATCVGILVRSVFRVAEFAGGYTGTIATHEGYFYLFDALPLWISMTLYCFVWPIRALNTHSEQSIMHSDSRMELQGRDYE